MLQPRNPLRAGAAGMPRLLNKILQPRNPLRAGPAGMLRLLNKIL